MYLMDAAPRDDSRLTIEIRQLATEIATERCCVTRRHSGIRVKHNRTLIHTKRSHKTAVKEIPHIDETESEE